MTHSAPSGLEGWLVSLVSRDNPGVLVLRGPQCACTFIIRKGHVLEVFVEPSQPSWDLGLLLASAGLLSEGQRRELEEVARAHQIESHEALARLDLLESKQLSMALQSRIVYVITKLFEQPIDGALFIEVGRISQRFSTRPVPLVRTVFINHLEGLAALDEASLDLKLEGRAQHRVSRVEPPPLAPEALALDKGRGRFYDKHLEGTRQLRDLLHLSNLPAVETKALLLALEAFGFVEIGQDEGVSTRAVVARVRRMADR